jgi:predicted nucleic acid-binding protein
LIIADTGALIALIDADDRHHGALRECWEADPDAWVVPWVVLPEVDYLLSAHVSPRAELAFLRDVADGRWPVEWGEPADLARAAALCEKHRALGLGLVDGVVMAVAERIGARAIATLDLRHFGAVKIRGAPDVYPRDLAA